MGEFVLDASAALELTRDGDEIDLPDGLCFAPAIIDVELVSTLRRLVRLKRMAPEKATALIEDWIENDLSRIHHLALLPRMWELRENITAYDAAYVALAEALEVPLVTADRRLARAASAYCEVITIGD